MSASVEISDLPARLLSYAGGEGFVGTQKSNHSPLCLGAGFLHKKTTLGNEPKAFCGREGASGGVGGEFAEGEAGGGVEGEVRFLFP